MSTPLRLRVLDSHNLRSGFARRLTATNPCQARRSITALNVALRLRFSVKVAQKSRAMRRNAAIGNRF